MQNDDGTSSFSLFPILFSLGTNQLRIDLQGFDNKFTFAKYESFKILDASQNYKLVLGKFLEGNAGKCSTSVLNLL